MTALKRGLRPPAVSPVVARGLIPVFGLVAVSLIQAVILLAGHRTYFSYPDNSLQFWPWYQKFAASLSGGSLPLWDLNTSAGHSFVGETQTGVFYPLNLIWLGLFGGAQGIGARRLDMLVVLHFLLASSGFYALARSFRLRQLACFIAAITFAYAGALPGRAIGQTAIFFGLALLPWAVFCAHRYLETGRKWWPPAAGAVVGLSLLAGHFQPPFHALLCIVLLYALTGTPPGIPRSTVVRARLFAFVTTLLVAVLVALPQLVYSLPYLGRAVRFIGPGPPVLPGHPIGFHTFANAYSGGPQSFLSLLDPQAFSVPDDNDLFLGLAGFVVLAVCWVSAPRHLWHRIGRYRAPLLAILLIGATAMVGSWTVLPRLLYVIPFVNEIRELARYAVMVVLVLCLMLAFGFDWLQREGVKSRLVSRLLLVLAAAILLNGVYLAFDPPPGGDRWFGIQLVLASGALAACARLGEWRHQREVRLAALGLLVVTSALYGGIRYVGRTDSPLYPPKQFARTPTITFLEQNCAGHRTLILDQALPQNVGDVFRAIHTENGYGATMHLSLYEFVTHVDPASAEGSALLDLRCIVAHHPITTAGYGLAFSNSSNGDLVYLNPTTSAVNTTSFRPVPVTILRQRDRELAYRITSRRARRVIVSAIAYPGWKLTLDGSSVPARFFNVGGTHVFPEVDVRAGTHTLSYSWSGWPS